MSYLQGMAGGTFKAGVQTNPGNYPNSIRVGDFNTDTNLDWVVANSGATSVSIEFGNGMGGFGGKVELAVNGNPYFVTTGDFDGRTGLDIATAGSGGITVLLNNGSGNSFTKKDVDGGGQRLGIVARDFNGDGKLDLAAVNLVGSSVTVYLGDGTGGFAAQAFAAGTGAYDVDAADFNSDGKLDLVTANWAGNMGTTVSVLLGNGDGTFAAPLSFAAGTGPISVVAAHMNSDGKIDLVVADNATNMVSVLLNTSQ